MKKFIFGLIIVVVITLILVFLFIAGNKNNSPEIVSPQDLIEGAQKFGSLRVVIRDEKKAFISGVEVDVGEHPGGKMAVATTDENGTVFFDKMPVGNFVVFFNDITYPKNFQSVSNLIPVKIIEGETTEQEIELKELK